MNKLYPDQSTTGNNSIVREAFPTNDLWKLKWDGAGAINWTYVGPSIDEDPVYINTQVRVYIISNEKKKEKNPFFRVSSSVQKNGFDPRKIQISGHFYSNPAVS